MLYQEGAIDLPSLPPPTSSVHARPLTSIQQLEPILQCPHIRISMPLQFKRIRDHLDWPRAQGRILASLEAQVEVAWMLGIEAEGVH